MAEKIVNNPDFTEDEVLDASEGDEEEKEPSDEEFDGEGDQSDASTDEEPGDETEVSETDTDVHSKEAELAALERDRQKIVGQDADLDREIEEKKREIVEARRLRRGKRDELRKLNSEPSLLQEDVPDLSDINQEDIDRMERVLKAKGYVRKETVDEELFRIQQRSTEEEFYNKYPQYKPENDPDDVLYNALKDEVSRFAVPRSPKEVGEILNRAHRFVADKYPSKFPKSVNASADNARRAKKSLAGTGTGSSSASPTQRTSQLTKAQREALLAGGFSEDDLVGM